MPGIKELKNKIKSIKSTRKITKAMQMVSAAKMRKAQTAALNSRKYSDTAWQLINSLSPMLTTDKGDDEVDDETLGDAAETLDVEPIEDVIKDSALALTKVFPKATKTGIIIVSTNKGLVGSFNTNLINKLREVEKGPSTTSGVTKSSGIDVISELLVMGKKVKEAAIRTNRNLIADFTKKDSWTPIEGIYPLAKTVTDLYLSGEYKQILIIYNHFVSTLTQKPTVKQLLPFTPTTPSRQVGTPLLEKEGNASSAAKAMEDKSQSSEYNRGASHPAKGEYPAERGEGVGADYLFEPTPKIVLEHLIPRIIESQIYQAVLESDASEHSARMVMMKNATEAAGDLIDDYTLTYNQLRQNKITTELAEITAGKIALE